MRALLALDPCPWQSLYSFPFTAVLVTPLSWVSLSPPDSSAQKEYGLVFLILTLVSERCCSRFSFVLYREIAGTTKHRAYFRSADSQTWICHLLSHVSDALWTVGDHTDSRLNNMTPPSMWDFLLHSLHIMSYNQLHMLKSSLLDSFPSSAAQS